MLFSLTTEKIYTGSTVTNCSEQNKSQESINSIVENSTLSVDAAEFVPKCQSYVVPMVYIYIYI